jgi:hypothetical protein
MKIETSLDQLRLTSLDDRAHAGLCMTSLPWPKAGSGSATLGGRSTGVLPVGQWPGSEVPRRLLLFADNIGAAPESFAVSKGTDAPTVTAAKSGKLSVEMELIDAYQSRFYASERHLLRIRGFGRSIGIAMGVRCQEGIHWWEACGMVILQENEHFIEVEMAGSIADKAMTEERFLNDTGYDSPYLHHHNWVSGQIYARLHSNGVCEIYAHHINSKFVDDGRELKDVVPVIGFKLDEGIASAPGIEGTWDGSREELEIGGVRLDVREVARLATRQQPGDLRQEGQFLVLQPYAGAELYGGICPEARTGDPFIFRAEQRTFPRGMARTLRFSLSLSDRSPVVARYVAPAWWYGLCEEFLPEPLLPVSNALDANLDEARQWLKSHQVRGGFEDGSVPRHGKLPREGYGRTRHEPGWEGEIGYAQFLAAWRTGNRDDYHDALRSAYCFTDVAIDHAAKMVRMHGYAPNAFSLPMNRVLSTVAAYLETGDPYLREAARAVTANSHWQHKNSWPRMAVGRDACYVRSAVLLYRYFGEEFYRSVAYEGAVAVAHSQRPNGSFGDQGGGSGIHQWSGFISKPWMGLLALNGVLDYLELFPNEPLLLQSVKKFADWLMSERRDYQGVRVWSYQHDYHGQRFYFNPITGKEMSLPTEEPWYHASLARLLVFSTLAFDDSAYLEAWAECLTQDPHEAGDHAAAATLQFVPWVQAKLWNARISEDGMLCVKPFEFGGAFQPDAIVHAPKGPVSVKRGLMPVSSRA